MADKAENISDSHKLIELTESTTPHNYHPLPVVISEGKGTWVTDPEGRRYLDMLSAYSAVSFGHCNPRLTAAAERQLKKITLTSRAFFNDEFAMFCKELSEFCGMDLVLPMNSGAEAVETAVKAARQWGYKSKGVQADKAEIITFDGNFHGRTTTIVGFSTSNVSRAGFGPFTPGFVIAPYGDTNRLRQLVTPRTVAILVEPIQGEGGVIIPPPGYLKAIRTLCDDRKILFLADEIQTGLCRTGKIFACDHESVKPDLYILGKSLGGAIVPISAVVGNKNVLGLFPPGSHGSTFGGNPFASAIAREVLALIREEQPEKRSAELGDYLVSEILKLKLPTVAEVRGRGLFVGVDIRPSFGPARKFCERLLAEGILAKDTRTQTIRFAPPLVIEKADIDWAMPRIAKALTVS